MPGNEDQMPTNGDGTNRIGDLLADLEAVDFERVDSPASVWEGIEAVVASEQARTPQHLGSLGGPVGMVVEYWIDADDLVTEVGQGWAEFARDNGAPDLAVPATDRTLWTYFDRDEVRNLWRLVIEHVRAARTSVQVPLRCDAPHARRWFDMTITPERDGRLHFRSALVFEEARPPVVLLDLGTERDDGARAVPLCSWCGRGQLGDRWLDIEALVSSGRLLEREFMPPISYGICAGCRDDMSADLLVPGRARDAAD